MCFNVHNFNPSAVQMNATAQCAETCPPGGIPIETIQSAGCIQMCIASNLLTPPAPEAIATNMAPTTTITPIETDHAAGKTSYVATTTVAGHPMTMSATAAAGHGAELGGPLAGSLWLFMAAYMV